MSAVGRVMPPAGVKTAKAAARGPGQRRRASPPPGRRHSARPAEAAPGSARPRAALLPSADRARHVPAAQERVTGSGPSVTEPSPCCVEQAGTAFTTGIMAMGRQRIRGTGVKVTETSVSPASVNSELK